MRGTKGFGGRRAAFALAFALVASAALVAPASASNLSFSPPGGLDFGSVVVGTQSAPQNVVFHSGPCQQLNTPGICDAAPDPFPPTTVIDGDFAVVSNSCGNQQPEPVQVSSLTGGDCTLSIVFAPASPGKQRGSISQASGPGTTGYSVPLTGRGMPPVHVCKRHGHGKGKHKGCGRHRRHHRR